MAENQKIFKHLARCELHQIAMCYTSLDSSRQTLWAYKLMESFFPNFKFVFELLVENYKIFKRIARREYWSKCNVLYTYLWIWLYKFYKLI